MGMDYNEKCLTRAEVPQGRAKASVASIAQSGQELNYAEESKELNGGAQNPIIPEPRKVTNSAPERVQDPGDLDD